MHAPLPLIKSSTTHLLQPDYLFTLALPLPLLLYQGWRALTIFYFKFKNVKLYIVGCAKLPILNGYFFDWNKFLRPQ